MTTSILDDIKKIFKNGNYLFQIIIVNAAIFIVLNIISALTPVSVFDEIIKYFGLSVDFSSNYWMVWTYITYMFTHLELWHIFFNMLFLYYLGHVLADLYGQRRVLETYLYGGIAGGLLYVIVSFFLPNTTPNQYLIGASGGVMAVMLATGVLQPNYILRFAILGEVKLKWVAIGGFVLSSLLDLDQNTGGKIAHIGGAVYGMLFALNLQKGTDINKVITKFLSGIVSVFTSKPKIKVVHKSKNYQKPTSPQLTPEEVDVILEKISKSGYDSLTKKEKEFLFKFSKK